MPYSPGLGQVLGLGLEVELGQQAEAVVDLFRRQESGREAALVGCRGIVVLLLLDGDEAHELVDLELLEGRLVGDGVGRLQLDFRLGELAGVGQLQGRLQRLEHLGIDLWAPACLGRLGLGGRSHAARQDSAAKEDQGWQRQGGDDLSHCQTPIKRWQTRVCSRVLPGVGGAVVTLLFIDGMFRRPGESVLNQVRSGRGPEGPGRWPGTGPRALLELFSSDDAHLHHAVALRTRQHLLHRVVLGARVSLDRDLGLRILLGLDLEVTFQGGEILDRRAVPGDRIVVVDQDVDHHGWDQRAACCRAAACRASRRGS